MECWLVLGNWNLNCFYRCFHRYYFNRCWHLKLSWLLNLEPSFLAEFSSFFPMMETWTSFFQNQNFCFPSLPPVTSLALYRFLISGIFPPSLHLVTREVLVITRDLSEKTFPLLVAFRRATDFSLSVVEALRLKYTRILFRYLWCSCLDSNLNPFIQFITLSVLLGIVFN